MSRFSHRWRDVGWAMQSCIEGARVRREDWPEGIALALWTVNVGTFSDGSTGGPQTLGILVWNGGGVDATRLRVWTPTQNDLLAGDWQGPVSDDEWSFKP
jgi:hypothetical protein